MEKPKTLSLAAGYTWLLHGYNGLMVWWSDGLMVCKQHRFQSRDRCPAADSCGLFYPCGRLVLFRSSFRAQYLGSEHGLSSLF
jgi:hypothetical protein